MSKQTIKTIKLSRALPLLMFSAFGCLFAFAIFYLHSQLVFEIERHGFENVRHLLANTESQVETLLRHNEQELIAEEIASYGTDLTINSLVLVDSNNKVMHATRLEWLGMPITQVYPDHPAELVNANQQSLQNTLYFSEDKQHIYGYQPVVLATASGQIRPSIIGKLILDYDLSVEKRQSWQILLRSTYPIWAVGLCLMFLVGTLITLWLERPLLHLTDVVKRFSSGDYQAKPNLSGHGELAVFAQAWNQVRTELAETINALADHKEQLAVTLMSIGDAVIATDIDGRVSFMNSIAQQLTGWSLLEAENKPLVDVFNIINAHSRQATEAPVQRVLSTGEIIGLANHTLLIARDGKEYQIADSAAPIRNREGQLLGVVLVFRDVTEEYALRESLENEKALLKTLIDAIPDLMVYKDINGHYLGCNRAFERIIDQSEQALIGKSTIDFFSHPIAETFISVDAEVCQTERSVRIESWLPYPDGRKLLFDTVKSPFYSRNGKLQGLVAISRDITESKRIAAQLAENEAQLRALGNNLPNGYIYQYFHDQSGQSGFVFISAGVEKIHGVSPEAVIKQPDLLLGQIDRSVLDSYKAAEIRSLEQMVDVSMELLMNRPDGQKRWIQFCSRPRYSGESIVWDGVALDITEKKQTEEQLWQQANFDQLTGLPNRPMFYHRLEQEIKSTNRQSARFALIFIDLDRFKEVNDSLGHDHGDELLKLASQRLLKCVRNVDTVSRLGGDEFTIIINDIKNVDSVEIITDKILATLSEPFLLNNEQVFVSASVGITIYPDDANDSAQLIRNADQAMYAAKDRGRNCYSYFTQSMHDKTLYRLSLAHELRDALAKQQFELYYQPIIHLASGQIFKAEALVRWHHPSKGLVSPAVFIPITEEIGLIHELGDWIFAEAIQQLKVFRERLHPAFQISINKSPIQFRRTSANNGLNWIDYLMTMSVPGDAVVIEITEGLLLDASKDTSEKLIAFRDAGIQISLDDFGTGYSSLSYIQKFDIDYIKIDQSFVRNISQHSTNKALCEAIILMAHTLGMKVIAEGIETEEQRQILMQAGCDFGQGYLFSKPIPAEAFINQFQNR